MHFKRIEKILILFLLCTVFIMPAAIAFADAETCGNDGKCTLKDAFKTGDGSNNDPLDSAASIAYDTSEAKTSPDFIIGTVIQTALSFLGVIFLVLMIYGGYLWMSAQGNEQQVEKAKNLITAAVVGLVIVVSAYAISYLVISKITEGALSS